jgi:predicted membrane protein
MDQAIIAGWLSRYWQWFVAVFCLLATAVIGALVAVAMSVALQPLKSGELYQQAVATAKLNAAVSESLGQPLKEGFFAG